MTPAATTCEPTRDVCTDNAPAGYRGHWRDWHRGHGCSKDPDAVRKEPTRPVPTDQHSIATFLRAQADAVRAEAAGGKDASRAVAEYAAFRIEQAAEMVESGEWRK